MMTAVWCAKTVLVGRCRKKKLHVLDKAGPVLSFSWWSNTIKVKNKSAHYMTVCLRKVLAVVFQRVRAIAVDRRAVISLWACAIVNPTSSDLTAPSAL